MTQPIEFAIIRRKLSRDMSVSGEEFAFQQVFHREA